MQSTSNAASAPLAVRLQQLQPFAHLVELEDVVAGQAIHSTQSFTRDDVKYHTSVDLESGSVFCSCPDFEYRHAKHEPTIYTPEHHCKHLVLAVQQRKENGELAHFMPDDAPVKPTPCPFDFDDFNDFFNEIVDPPVGY